jgi:hypothetical protein
MSLIVISKIRSIRNNIMHTPFTDIEARSHVGDVVETVTNLHPVPLGTRGRVVGADPAGAHGWIVRVEWDLPPRRSSMLAQFGEFSFNLPWRSKVPTGEFGKSEFENCLRRLEN